MDTESSKRTTGASTEAEEVTGSRSAPDHEENEMAEISDEDLKVNGSFDGLLVSCPYLFLRPEIY